MTKPIEPELLAAREKLRQVLELAEELDRGRQHGNLWIVAVQIRQILRES